MDRNARVRSRVAELIARFEHYIDVFDSAKPFRKWGQYEFHIKTIRLLRELGSIEHALGNPEFMRNLWETLKAWLGARGSRLEPYEEFCSAVRGKLDELRRLEALLIDDPELDVSTTANALWALIDTLGIVNNNARLVSCTKTLHHLLPNLVVPMDRRFTQTFFGWHNPEFQYQQRRVFHEAFRQFVVIARSVPLGRYVGSGWHTSRTKVLDNALVGYCLAEGLVAGIWGEG